MKKTLFLLVIFIVGLFSANAADMIILKDGNVIEAKIMEMHPNEIRYKRADNLNGPMVFLPKSGVLSVKYENGVVELINAPPSASPAQPAPPAQTASPPSAGQQSGQTAGAGSNAAQQPVAQTILQTSLTSTLQNTLNTLPAIKIAGNNLKFQFAGENWTALLNGENFSTGTVEVEDTAVGSILTLRQTHIWPGAVAGKAAGKLTSKIPGGAVAGGTLNAAGPVEASGPAMVLEYKAGPPAKLAYLRSTTAQATSQTASVQRSASTPENPDSISGKRYEVVEKGMSWTKAQSEAEKRGGYLAVITNAEEQEAIANLISTGKKSGYWLGGLREGSVWKWVNGEPMNYTNWARGEPNKSGDKMIIMRIPFNGAKFGQWDDVPTSTGNGYIIEYPRTETASAPSVQPAPTPAPAVQPAPIPAVAQAPVNPAPTPSAVPPAAGQQAVAQTPVAQASAAQTPGVQTSLQASLQNTLNTLPAITIAGNNLKFQFSGENWTALLNGENFSTGTIEVEDTNGGALLTLRQTHIWPGAVAGKAAGKAAGKLTSKLPGGSAVGGAALDAAGKAVGPIEASGTAMVLEYKAGPPAKLAYLRSTTATTAASPVQTVSGSAGQATENPDFISNKRYEVVNKKMNWENAKREAESRGGYLAVITSAEEQKTIRNLGLKQNERYWLGGFREDRVWKWVNGEPFNYKNWQSGEPNNSGGNEDKIEMMPGNMLCRWNDNNRNMKNYFIIQWD